MKNKTAPPMRVGVTPFYFTDHFPFRKGDYDVVSQLWNIALTYDIIERHGAWYHYGAERWNGKDAVLQALREDLDLRHAIEAEVRKLVSGDRSVEVGPGDTADDTASPTRQAPSSPAGGAGPRPKKKKVT